MPADPEDRTPYPDQPKSARKNENPSLDDGLAAKAELGSAPEHRQLSNFDQPDAYGAGSGHFGGEEQSPDRYGQYGLARPGHAGFQAQGQQGSHPHPKELDHAGTIKGQEASLASQRAGSHSAEPPVT